MEHALDNEMHDYFMQLNDAEKKSVIQMLKIFVARRSDKSERISIEQYNQELKEAEAEYESGEYATHEEFVKQLKKW